MRPITRLSVVAVVAVLLSPAAATAGIEWIDLPVATGGSVKALLGLPDGVTKAPAVVYSHGTAVRRLGYDAAKAQGYDIADFVVALNNAGYVALAPVRNAGVLFDTSNLPKGAVQNESTPSIQAGIEQGVAALQAAVGFLRSHPTATGKLGAVGFSEGGLVTTWAAIGGLNVEAVVLMSPATIRDARRLNMKNAAQSESLAAITSPMLITLGADDNPSILKGVNRRLIPALNKAGVKLETRLDYPGDHKWFWRVREPHFADVLRFFDTHLK